MSTASGLLLLFEAEKRRYQKLTDDLAEAILPPLIERVGRSVWRSVMHEYKNLSHRKKVEKRRGGYRLHNLKSPKVKLTSGS